MTLRSGFYTRKTFHTLELAYGLISTLMAHPRFAPDVYGPYEPLRKFTLKDIDTATAIFSNEAGQKSNPYRVWSSILFQRRKQNPKTSYFLQWSDLPHKTFDRNFISTDSDILSDKSIFQEWRDFFLHSCSMFESWYATCALENEKNEKHLLNWHVKLRSGNVVESFRGAGYELYEGIPGVYWGNYFGPFLVEWFGQERFLSLPCHSIEWLETGGVFFTTAASPDLWNTPTSLAYQQAIKVHLGIEYFFDLTLVKHALEIVGTIPDGIKPEQLQRNRKTPIYPFEVIQPSREIDFEAMQSYFISLGYQLIQRVASSIVFENDKGDRVRITNDPIPAIEYHPNV